MLPTIRFLQELHILLTPDQEHKKVFQDISVVSFRRAKLPNVGITGRSESCEKGNCQVCDYFICETLLPTKPVLKNFKFKVGYLTVPLRRSFIF